MKAKSIMKALILFIILLPGYTGASNLGELRMGLVHGDVQIRTEDTDDWVEATINMPLRDGDRIWVPDGARAEIQARNGSVLRLDEKSSFEILTVEYDSLQFYLSLGQAYTNFRGPRDSIIQIDTPVASVRVYDHAKFNIAVSRDGDTDLSVFRGAVYAESRSGRTRVQSGKMLSLGDRYADLSPLGRSDAWEEWNTERDRVFEESRYSSHYLPDELEGYASDLDNNGRWIYTSSYGYVWTPTVALSLGWAPYREGRWVWMGGDYVWIAYEPWGWVPYHYGRWSFITAFGWCWIPPDRGDVYWGPGYVGWVYTPTYVSWVPLAPREIYYGYGNYGRHSVNIVNVNINRYEVRNIYRNVHVHNSVTVVHHDTFLKGRRMDVPVRENPFLKEQISIGRPRIEPERATRMPSIKDIPKGKEPPKMVRGIQVRELQERRRFFRERDRSVFTPETPPKALPIRRTPVTRTGDAIRTETPENKAVKSRMQRFETEQPVKTAPESRREIQEAPAEKKTVQPKGAVPQPAIQKKYRQTEQPKIERKPQPSKDGEGSPTERKEKKLPFKQQELLQPPAGDKTIQPEEASPPQPVIKRKEWQTEQPMKELKKPVPQKEGRTGKDRSDLITGRRQMSAGRFSVEHAVQPEGAHVPRLVLQRTFRQTEQAVTEGRKPLSREEKKGKENQKEVIKDNGPEGPADQKAVAVVQHADNSRWDKNVLRQWQSFYTKKTAGE